jgi:DNA-binding transcriptional LysR family regulator
MKISSNHLEAFYSVARNLSFSKGAKTIHVTQSAVSQRLSALEGHLEATLFIRDRANLKLTLAGEKLLRYCQYQEQHENELLSVLKITDSKSLILGGEIRIGGFSSIARSGIVPALAPMLQKHPEVGFTLVTKELSDLLPILKTGEVDFIITNKNPDRQEIESLYLGVEENVLVESRRFPNSLNCLDHDSNDITTTSYFKISNIELKKFQRRYVDDVYGLIDGVRNGLGCAVLPKHLIENEKEFKILQPASVLRVSMYLLFYKQPYYGKLHSIVVDDIQNYFKKYFAQDMGATIL